MSTRGRKERKIVLESETVVGVPYETHLLSYPRFKDYGFY